MKESGYFPAGAEFNPSAPYNQSDLENVDFEVTCSQSLSKTVTVATNNYIPDDSEGNLDTSNVNWAEEYHDGGNHTPLQLLELFRQCLEENLRHGLVFRTPRFTEDLIKECQGWVEDETEYIEED